jgi:hypothetical protein
VVVVLVVLAEEVLVENPELMAQQILVVAVVGVLLHP